MKSSKDAFLLKCNSKESKVYQNARVRMKTLDVINKISLPMQNQTQREYYNLHKLLEAVGNKKVVEMHIQA